MGVSLGTLALGYDLGKDLLNVDRNRDVAASQKMADYNYNIWQAQAEKLQGFNESLMEQQYDYNRWLQQMAYDYGISGMMLQHDLNKDSQAIAQQYNQANMQKQFEYNNYLSSMGRNIIAERANGINPSSGTPGSGSVTAPGSSPLSSSAPGSPGASVGLPGAPSAPGGSGNYAVHQSISASNVVAQAAQAEKAKQEAKGTEIDNLTRLTENYTRISQRIQEINNLEKQGKVLDEDVKREKTNNEYLAQKILAQIQAIDAEAAKNIDLGRSSYKMAEVAEQTLQEQKYWHDIQENLSRTGLYLNSRQIKAYEDYVQNLGLLQSEQARSTREDADFKHMTRYERHAQLIKSLNLTDKQSQLLRLQAEKEGISIQQLEYELFIS